MVIIVCQAIGAVVLFVNISPYVISVPETFNLANNGGEGSESALKTADQLQTFVSIELVPYFL